MDLILSSGDEDTILAEDQSFVVTVDSDTLEVLEDGFSVSVLSMESDTLIQQTEELSSLAVDAPEVQFVESVLPGPPGPAGPIGPPGTELAQTLAGPILVGTTQTVDSISVSLYSAVTWSLVIKDLVANKYMYLTINAAKSPSQSTPKHAKAAILAEKLSVSEDVTFDGSNMILTLTNNNVNPVYVSFIRSRVI